MHEIETKTKKLLIIFGPPAVGKTTVGKILESKSDFKLFHNHMVMDSVMHLFGVGTHSEDKLSRIIRESIIKEAAEVGMNLIFTYVWNFGKEKGKTNNDPMRNVEKKYAPNRDRVLALENTLNFVSPNPFFYPEFYLKIDTTDISPKEIASIIQTHFNF